MPSSKPSKPTPYDIHMAEMAEPYQDNEGVIGFAIPLEPGHWEAHNKWSETNPELGALLEKKQIVPWYLPTKPDPSDSLDDLYIAINQILGEYIWFPDARNNSLISNWILTSWIYDLHEYSPRIYLYATTKSGKSHTLEAINQLSYHGLKSLVNPTPAVLYRIIQQCHPTITMDESQDQDKNPELAIGIDTIFKAGFQKGSMTPRCEEKGSGIIYYDLFGPMAMASKNEPKEDLINRSFPINMLTAPKETSNGLKRRFDKVWAAELRGRELTFRMNILTGKIPIEDLIKQATEMAEGDIFVGESTEPYKLDGRSIDKATPLLATGIYYKDTHDILELLVDSEMVSAQNMQDTLEGQILHAFQECLIPSSECQLKVDLKDLTTTDVCQQLNADLANQGNARKEEIKTNTVGKILRKMGFKFKVGTGNRSYFLPEDFEKAYNACQKYGYRNGAKDRYSLENIQSLTALNRAKQRSLESCN